MKVERTGSFKIYNLDKKEVQELVYPEVITMSDETDKVAEMRVKAPLEFQRARAALLLNVAQEEIARDPVMKASSQLEGGFFVMADPNEVAFFNCTFKEPREVDGRENFGFRCRPITMGAIGGPENWLYGHLFEERCEKVYDRETGKVIPKPQKFVMGLARYYCACRDEEVEDYVEKWRHALEKLQEYDDLVRFTERSLEGVDISKMREVEERLRETLKRTEEEREIAALGKFIEHLVTREDSQAPSEELRELFIKRYRKIW